MRFLRYFLLFLALIVGVFIGMMRAVNPRGEFAAAFFPPVYLNVRMEKLGLFRGYNAHRHVSGLILGSSRSMKIAPRALDALDGGRTFNFGLHAAQAEDLLGAFRWAVGEAPGIRTIYLGYDPTILLRGPRLKLVEHTWALYSAVEGIESSPWARLRSEVALHKDLFTVSYVADMARSISAAVTRPEGTHFTEPDGRLEYPKWNREIAAGTYPFRAI